MTEETGMLDVGTHCAYCRQLDFLPFHCRFCNLDFCEIHRTKESHHCRWLLDQERNNQRVPSPRSLKSNDEKFFKSLLPEKGYVRVQQQRQQQQRSPLTPELKPIKSQISQGTLDKLTRFFKRSTVHKSTSKKSSSSKLVQLSQLKKNAVGDERIPVANRIYIWCYVVHDEERDKDAKRESFYVNKIWPIGRVLDAIAQQFGVPNRNDNFKTKQEDKLSLYKIDQGIGEMVQLETSGRVANQISDLDTLYLIRGTDVPNLKA
ncbi:hypothetical protein ZYGR_0AV02230 [Zygosaccharomyces rouxii]|uniref:AN1-type domain-containing protein n=1 Tax=Zygosaccharomyces rouxii TaxID=4956 RepID=A0A1Q3AIP4_ZYGRO|nr:hypothetical protein ZYGR_0AV02230 [Zygosaccharomyces rouxii]